MTINNEIGLTESRKNLTAWLKAFNDRDLDALFALYDNESV